ncbi:MAG: hypothetical protein WC657_03015 [Candidatus Paceibacterota bacterium]|jgi:hypothetical protein
MRKTFLTSYLFFIIFFVFTAVSHAGQLAEAPVVNGIVGSGWQDQGGGWYFKNPNYSNADGTIQFGTSNEWGDYLRAQALATETIGTKPIILCNTSNCAPEWADAQIGCFPGSYSSTNHTCSKLINGSYQTIAVCDAGNTTGPCRPARVNLSAAQSIAQNAEIILRNHGYTNVSCVATKENWASIGYDTNTGLQYYYNSLCTVNGKSGISAELLVNNPSTSLKLTDEYVTGTSPVVPVGIGNLNTQTPLTQTSTSQNTYIQNLTNVVNNIIQQYKNILNSLNTSAQKSVEPKIPTFDPPISLGTNPVVELTLDNGQKNGTYSVGDNIIYKIKMENLDSINSFYNTIPGDTCDGGSKNGEQKPWIAKAIAPQSSFIEQVKPCQAGSNYVITVVGTNKTSGKIVASSILVYIRP